MNSMNNGPSIPLEAEHALCILQDMFEDTLVAVYLHGSAVSGGLRPSSDVDILAVVSQPTTHAQRESLVAELMQISGQPADPDSPRPLELIIFNQADLITAHYPARSEFVYGEWLRQEFQAGEVPHPGSDPEFTVILLQARRAAKTLFGQEPAEILPVIAINDLLRAMSEALPALIKSLEGDERNVLLTLARMWVTVTTGTIVSKDVAAEWAMPHLPADYSPTIAAARAAYLGLENDDWTHQGARVRQTADYMHREISELLRTTCALR
ncbi:aminoglycoside adenylyltransferase family protein [Ensifer adhaerens]|uniref:aminoglycoside adenylyltransferase family protein n=1 Tax=Ensifer adhaerens TaxID=106592 RepID=UPI001EF39053|nr:aminoglycoside adenylyltransferase family protein [Ensifer adhaerens]MDF8357578.1 aminoglycoside adenylyltransferase family protein [Ensifer adhaerens]